jgi:DNA-directed RNA polymerase specialized sigma24 family protein
MKLNDAHYVDNKKFYQAIIEYRTAVADAITHNNPRPRIPEYIGECIFLIANRLATKPNFANYSYKDDMIADGIENCICYIDNFDPAKSDNPFAYFTQIIYFAFLKRLQKEKKQLYIKHKSLENASIYHTTFTRDEEENGEFTFDPLLDNQVMHDFIKSFEKDLEKKKQKRKKGLEKFIEDDEEQ